MSASPLGAAADCGTANAAPLLIFGYGNPARGDDALGSALIARLAKRPAGPGMPPFALLTDFQPQVEHTLDLQDRRQVVFVDADATLEVPFRFTPLRPEPGFGYTTHALHPGALLTLWKHISPLPPPSCFLLAIRGYGFALGAPLSRRARANLEQAEAFLWEHCGLSGREDRSPA